MSTARDQKEELNAHSLINLLGGEKVIKSPLYSEFDLILLSQQGISKASLEALITNTGVPKKFFIEKILDISVKTIERKQENDRLNQRTSSHLIEIAKVMEHAYTVFESAEKVHYWLNTENQALNNLKPINLFSISTGLLMVNQVLGRIEEGVFS
ncbi:MAG: DUF2384 domain-containing protein [Sphingobacteriaceae bacterium]|nr:MAG: DUF2384 domain-containing protein [Sphingobacteriaceae bacterium]